MDQKRKFSRLTFNNASTLFIGDEKVPVAVALIDISFKGALVEPPSGQEMVPGTPILLRVQLDHSEIHIDMKTEVAHVEAGRAGLRCTSIDLDSMTHLRRMMELNLGDPGLLEREVLHLG